MEQPSADKVRSPLLTELRRESRIRHYSIRTHVMQDGPCGIKRPLTRVRTIQAATGETATSAALGRRPS